MSNNLTSKHFVTVVGRSLLVIIFLLLPACIGLAQSSLTDGTTPPSNTPGSPAGAYPLSDLDSVNPFNGNLGFHLPLHGVHGRGDVRLPMTLSIEQHWRVEHYYNPFIGYHQYWPSSAWWVGIQPGYGPGVLQGRTMAFGAQVCDPNSPSYLPEYTLLRLTFTTPDGTEFELRDQNTGGQPRPVPACATTGALRGTVFVTADGTSATFTSDADKPIYDDVYSLDTYALYYPSGVLTLRDGTHYRIDKGLVSWMRDRNGNLMTFTYDANKRVRTITDSLNREVTITYDVQDTAPYGLCDQIKFQGFGGAQRIVRVSKTGLGNALRSDFSLQTEYQLFPELNSSCNYCTVGPPVVSAVWLPDGKSYKFYYNSYIELARVELPTGGAYEYDHAGGLSNGPASGAWILDPDVEIYRRTTEKRIYSNGNTLQGVITFSKPESFNSPSTPQSIQTSGYVLEDHLDSQRARLSRTKHYYYGHIDSSPVAEVGYAAWNDGREYQTDFIAADGSTILRRVNYTWRQRASIPWWNAWASSRVYPVTPIEPANDPRLVETVTTLMDATPNLVSKRTSIDPADLTGQTVGFDQYNNQTDVWEYDYGQGAAAAYPSRRTHTDYLSTNLVDGVSYNYRTDALIYLRSLPTRAKLYAVNPATGAETLISDTAMAYDQSSVTDYAGISGMDAAFTGANKTRGNVTSISRWLNTDGTWLTTYMQYDVAGNVISTTDARNNVTQLEYSSAYQFAYLTRSISPIPDTGWGLSSTTALITSSAYDFSTGLVTSTTDANNKITTIAYNDPLERPTQVNRPDGGWTTYEYGSTIYGDYLHIQTLQNSAGVVTDSYQFYDGLGRPYRAFQYEGVDPTNIYLTSDTQYDALGRVRKVSNTYRSQSAAAPINPSDNWTTTSYDALGRVTSVKTPDNAVVTTSYSGNQVTVTDQAAKTRRSIADGLGRLTTIIEDPNGLSYQTNYVYDASNNLRVVAQGSQRRYFMYDSLSRLIRARNPEQNTNPNLDRQDIYVAPGDGAANYQWGMAYTYDNNGNLLTRTDARGITANYTYDNMNRNIRVSYSDGSNNDFHFDNAINGRGRMYYSVSYVNSSLPESANLIDSYDVMGRPLSQRQRYWVNGAWGDPYIVQRTYDLAGHVAGQTYPSGHTVSYSYDRMGRTTAFNGNLGDGVTHTYMTALAFDDSGRMTREQFGTTTPLYNKRHYNVRGQLYDIRLSSVNDDSNWNRGAVVNYYSLANYGFGTSGTDNNGNLWIQQNWIPSDDSISSYSYQQQNYNYDTLNRITTLQEYTNGSSNTGAQYYSYDRWGNRTITPSSFGIGINTQQFTVDSTTNRLGVPAGLAGVLQYDANGNLTNDTYSGYGTRAYDAENRIVTAAASSGGQSIYTYNADGQRVRRQTGGQTTWQVYGIEGELVAEYAANASASTPQKEYGYRNGELLITATASTTQGPSTNVAQGKTATQSSEAAGGAALAVDGNTNGNWYSGTVTHTDYNAQAWWQVDLGASYSIQTIKVWNRTDCCSERLSNFYVMVSDSPINSTDLSQLSQQGGTGYYTAGQGGSPTTVTINRTGRYVRVQLSGTNYLSLAEVEVMGTPAPPPPTNLALNKTATQSSEAAGGAALAVDGNTNGNWYSGTVTHTDYNAQAWWQVDLGSVQSLSEVKVWNRTDCCSERLSNFYVMVSNSPINSTSMTALTEAGGSSYFVSGQGGSPSSVSVNRTGRYVRVQLSGTNYLSLAEVQVFGGQSGGGENNNGSMGGIEWLVTDQLGTPRMVVDQSGSLSSVRRHDYLPFGEELIAGTGGRTTGQGFVADGVRQKFAGYERDGAVALDYAQERYYTNVQGRFTTPDPLMASAHLKNPQSWNRYSYVLNRPSSLVDPNGLSARPTGGICPAEYRSCTENDGDVGSEETARGLAEYDEQFQHQSNAMAAIRAAQAGDYETLNNLLIADPTLVATQQIVGPSPNSTMVVVWDPVEGSKNPVSMFGHVSYITMQNDTSYSWQGVRNWTTHQPSARYTDEKSMSAGGMGYVLDFGAEINAKFQAALLSAYDLPLVGKRVYNPVGANCGYAFIQAINAIAKEIGVPKIPRVFRNEIFPAKIKSYIEKNLIPKGYVNQQQKFPMQRPLL